MFLRVKSSVIGGALCSLLTVFIMCHLLKLSVHTKYTHYLDSTEITNYTLVESLLLPSKEESTTTPHLKSDYIHFTLEELKQLATTTSSSTATIIIQYHSIASLQLQLQAIHNQHKFQASTIHIVCDTKEEKSTIEQFINNRDKYITSQRVQGKLWYQHINDVNNHVIILDKQVVPGQNYFNFIIGLLNTSNLRYTLLGTEGISTNICQQNEAHYVHSIKDVYVLHKEWYLNLIGQENTTKSISQSLQQTLHIPSVIIPTSLTDNKFHGNTKSKSCINVSPNGLMFIKEKNEFSSDFNELICKFSQKHDIIHLVTYGEMDTANLPSCDNNNIIYIHSVVEKVQELDRIINKISPSVVLYEKTKNNVILQEKHDDVTIIGLPTKDIPKVTFWITDLSLETITKWHIPKMHLIITIGGKNRLNQVKELFKSIQKSSYLGDNVELSILMDEKSDKSLEKYVNDMKWKHGIKNLRHRISGVHPMQIFTEAWYPTDNHEYAIMLDDRIELSNSFYIWLKYTVLKYRYQQQQQTLFSISLYSPRIIDTDPSGRQLLKSPSSNSYLMQLPNSLGGALYFPEHWREFHDYITARLTDQATVKRGSGNPHLFKESLLTISRTNKWSSSWRKYFDEMIYMRGYVALYPSSSYSTLTTVAKGTVNNKKKKELYIGAEKLFSVPLASSSELRELPDLELLPVLDLHGKLVESHKILLERGHTLQQKFSACKPIINHLNDPSDMLCPFNQWVTIPIEQETNPLPKTMHLLLP